MESQVGPALREARGRRKIELAEVEAAIRIRVRFLRALENEEWDVLPGGVYTRGFIRTYASFLGLDGERLVEEYRQAVEGPSYQQLPPAALPTASGSSSGGRSLSRLRWLALPAVLLVAVVTIVALPDGERDEGPVPGVTDPAEQAGGSGQPATVERVPPPRGVSVRLSARAEVWICLLDAGGQPLVNGEILEAGAEEGPFRSGSFTVSFGNGEVSMLIDGRQAEIPATASPIGYAVDSSGQLTELVETERPTCT